MPNRQKTLCWRFVIGGEPFSINNHAAVQELANRLSEIAKEVADLMPVSVSQGYVTQEMKALRNDSLAKRVATYQAQRIQGQMHWYSEKSEHDSNWGRRWSFVAIVGQALALGLGVVGAANGWSVDFVGLFSAAAASAVAWIAVKQYEVLARSYAVASSELGVIDARIESSSWTEPTWAAFVNEAEEAISREHTSWRASRAV